MKFLLDHDVPGEVAHLLRHWGHDAMSLRHVLPITTSDEGVFRHAQGEGRIIITCNRAHFLTLAEGAVETKAAVSGLDRVDSPAFTTGGVRALVAVAPAGGRDGPDHQHQLRLRKGRNGLSFVPPSGAFRAGLFPHSETRLRVLHASIKSPKSKHRSAPLEIAATASGTRLPATVSETFGESKGE